MDIKDEMRSVKALKEVIVAGQDGNIYFYNLLSGALKPGDRIPTGILRKR